MKREAEKNVDAAGSLAGSIERDRTPQRRRASRCSIIGMLLRGGNTRVLVLRHHFVVCLADEPGDAIPDPVVNAIGQLTALMKPCSTPNVNLVIGQIFECGFDEPEIGSHLA